METTHSKSNLFPKEVNKEQCIGTGMAIVLILILVGLYTKGAGTLYFKISIIILLINMTVPKLFYPIAIGWFGLANVMGAIMSKVMLSALFVFMVIPFGVIRKLLGHDSMKLKEWKKGKSSVFKDRNKTFEPVDMVHPY